MNVDSGSLGRPPPGATQLAVGFGQSQSFQLSDCAPDPAKLCQPKGWCVLLLTWSLPQTGGYVLTLTLKPMVLILTEGELRREDSICQG